MYARAHTHTHTNAPILATPLCCATIPGVFVFDIKTFQHMSPELHSLAASQDWHYGDQVGKNGKENRM
jgi:hypothetical protein